MDADASVTDFVHLSHTHTPYIDTTIRVSFEGDTETVSTISLCLARSARRPRHGSIAVLTTNRMHA